MKKKILCIIVALAVMLMAIPTFADSALPQYDPDGGIKTRSFTNANIQHYWRPGITVHQPSSFGSYSWTGNVSATISALSHPSNTSLTLSVVKPNGKSIGGVQHNAGTESYTLNLYDYSLPTICLELRNANWTGTITTSGSFSCAYTLDE